MPSCYALEDTRVRMHVISDMEYMGLCLFTLITLCMSLRACERVHVCAFALAYTRSHACLSACLPAACLSARCPPTRPAAGVRVRARASTVRAYVRLCVRASAVHGPGMRTSVSACDA